MYIRATINGIRLLSQSEPVAVAVGDTFLFSPLVHASEADMAELRRNVAKQQLIPHMTDFCCATAEIPYYATMNGLGYEEDYARLVHILLRNQQLYVSLSVATTAVVAVLVLTAVSLLCLCLCLVLCWVSVMCIGRRR